MEITRTGPSPANLSQSSRPQTSRAGRPPLTLADLQHTLAEGGEETVQDLTELQNRRVSGQRFDLLEDEEYQSPSGEGWGAGAGYFPVHPLASIETTEQNTGDNTAELLQYLLHQRTTPPTKPSYTPPLAADPNLKYCLPSTCITHPAYKTIRHVDADCLKKRVSMVHSTFKDMEFMSNNLKDALSEFLRLDKAKHKDIFEEQCLHVTQAITALNDKFINAMGSLRPDSLVYNQIKKMHRDLAVLVTSPVFVLDSGERVTFFKMLRNPALRKFLSDPTSTYVIEMMNIAEFTGNFARDICKHGARLIPQVSKEADSAAIMALHANSLKNHVDLNQEVQHQAIYKSTELFGVCKQMLAEIIQYAQHPSPIPYEIKSDHWRKTCDIAHSLRDFIMEQIRRNSATMPCRTHKLRIALDYLTRMLTAPLGHEGKAYQYLHIHPTSVIPEGQPHLKVALLQSIQQTLKKTEDAFKTKN